MNVHFVYIWFDKNRRMFYIGKHSGNVNDGYKSSSGWLNGEIRYRPQDFKRRILKIFQTEHEAQVFEGSLFKKVKPNEWGRKYYNTKIGKPLGVDPWNKGKQGIYSDEYRRKISESRKGKPTTKGKRMPKSAETGRKYAKHLSSKTIGRRIVFRDGKRTWAYPEDKDYPTNSIIELVGHST